MSRLFIAVATLSAFALAVGQAAIRADEAVAKGEKNVNDSESDVDLYNSVVQKGTDFLVQRQASDGSFDAQLGPGITSLATTALLRHGRSADDPVIAKAIAYIESTIKPDGGIYQEGSLYRNYETCLAVLCLTEVNEEDRYAKTLERADRFIKGLQWDETEGKGPDDFGFGGGGYGKHQRPDLSNTQFLIEALKATGNEEDSPAIQRALVFVSRCQNLEGPHNQTPFAKKNSDGGFYYTPAAGGSSQAGETPNGGLRSYASMTYAGLKSMIFAGVGPEDKRVKAAVDWLSKHYDLTSNPGMGTSGLFYYYHTFAKALDAMGQETFVTADGQVHHWRQELLAELARRQQPNGSWSNDNNRWLENEHSLVTSYVLLALSHARP